MDVHPALLHEDDVWAAVDEGRRGVVDLLESLTAEEWERPSLCAGWRVRDVAAHLALAHTGPGAALIGLARSGGSLDRMVHDTARRHATVPREQLVTEIRGLLGSRRHAPGITHLEPLLDVLVHTQDIAVPLQRSRPMPVDAATTAATRLWTMGWPLSRTFRARHRLRGLQLVATDADWSVGAGPRVEGPVEALLLLLAGRTAWVDRLAGPGVDRLVTATR